MAITTVIQTSDQKTHNPLGSSDPISYTCMCGQPGSVLLFYRYFANDLQLPEAHFEEAQQPQIQADFQKKICEANGLTGKIRVSKEGFNVTVAGCHAAIEKYIDACIHHWSFAALDVGIKEKQDSFFKPTPGCRCCFPSLSVRTTSEITPLGLTNYSPSSWSNIAPLPPAEFHRIAKEEEVKLVDVRNHYESRIGFFVDGKGREAIKPAVRRFGQWPRWVQEHKDVLLEKADKEEDPKQKPILSYCTGGIRCEKGSRWMEESLRSSGKEVTIHTLDGGIASYITWMEEEIKAGRMKPDDSLFKGQNYVFDARGSLGIEGVEPVSKCHVCGRKSARLGKCMTDGCHLVLVVCEQCDGGGKDVRCCESCLSLSKEEVAQDIKRKRMCKCEQTREKGLWGDEKAKQVKSQGWKKEKKKLVHKNVRFETVQKANIKIKVVESVKTDNEMN